MIIEALLRSWCEIADSLAGKCKEVSLMHLMIVFCSNRLFAIGANNESQQRSSAVDATAGSGSANDYRM